MHDEARRRLLLMDSTPPISETQDFYEVSVAGST
jgi:hypothetical protein